MQYATDLHATQTRKGKNEPYLSHILTVAGMVAHYGGNEDQIIAAVLHDAVEDQGGPAVQDEIRDRFGDVVADIVQDCSDASPAPGGLKAPWQKRKLAYITTLRGPGAPGSRLVEACDKLANLRDIVEDVQESGDDVFNPFNGGRKGTLEYYATLGAVLMPQVGVPALVREYQRLLDQLLTGEGEVVVWS